MSLRRRTITLIIILTLSLVVFLALITYLNITAGFSRIERVITQREVSRVVDQLDAELTNLARTAQDYSVWDDTYTFLQDGNEEYTSQFTDDVLANLAVNLLAFVNTDNKVLYLRHYDYLASSDLPLSPDLANLLQINSPLLEGITATNERSGLVQLPEGMMMAAAHPVLTNEGSGPVPGYIVVGRWLNEAELNRLGSLLKVTLAVASTNNPSLAPDMAAALTDLQNNQGFTSRLFDRSTLAGYTLLLDLGDKPVSLLRVNTPRDTYAAQQASSSLIFGSLLFVSLLFGLTTLFFVDKSVLRPLEVLKNEIKRVGQGKEHNARLKIHQQGDEIEQVAVVVNLMLDNVEASAKHQRHLVQIRTAAEISRKLNTLLDTPSLLQSVVDLICERFNLYFVGLFLTEPGSEFAVMHAGTGEAGKLLVATQHKLEIGGNSMVGWAVANRQARISLDAGQEAVRFNNPLLPYTRSEMALPIMTMEHVLGALTIQSSHPGAFEEEDITVLQGIADSLAIAMENTRLFTQAQHDYAEIRNLHRQYVSASWSELSSQAELRSYTHESAQQHNEDAPGASLTLPLRLRDQVIGSLSLETDKPFLTLEEQVAAQAVADQAALALENARLLESTRLQVEKQRLIASISSQTWASADIESILKHAMQELGNSLSASEGWVQLEINDTPENLPA